MATIVGTDQPDSLLGTADDDLVQGLEGADTLDGAEGIDTLEGGVGDDTYFVGETRREVGGVWGYYNDEVVELADEGVDTVVWVGLGGYMLRDNIEHAVAGTRQSGGLYGNALDNDLTGWDGGTHDGNWLEGRGGNDTLRGGSWDDSLAGGDGDDSLLGQNGPNLLDYTLDRDTLDGGAGADTMAGGDGYDTYWADELGDVVIEIPTPAGLDETEAYYYSYDTIYWTGQGVYQLPEHVEYLHLRGGATEALGNAQANVFFSDYGGYDQSGNEIGDAPVTIDAAGGDDTIAGGSGGDVLFGGDGTDSIEGHDLGDTLHGGAGDDLIHGDTSSYQGMDVLYGEEGDDLLEGDLGDDSIEGGEGSDVLVGSWGDDTLTGGAGIDRFTGGNEIDVVTDFTDGEDFILGDFAEATISQDGADTLIFFPGDWGYDDETLRLIGVDATLITADDFMTYVYGSDYGDSLTGGAQGDYLSGGDGDDTMATGGGDDAATGETGADMMDGGGGRDALNGGSGDDTIAGGKGADTLAGGSGDDRFIVFGRGDLIDEKAGGGIDSVESRGDFTLGDHVENLRLLDPASATARAADTRLDGIGNVLGNEVTGSSGANRLSGLGGDDRLNGRGGDDWLVGGKGSDLLKGGAGADIFSFAGVSGRDRIADFSSAEGDRIRIDSPDATRFEDLRIKSDGHGGAIVSWGGNRIALADVAPGSLSASDFSFASAEAAPFII